MARRDPETTSGRVLRGRTAACAYERGVQQPGRSGDTAWLRPDGCGRRPRRGSGPRRSRFWPPGVRHASLMRSCSDAWPRWRGVPTAQVPTWFEDWLDAEREAQSLLIWSPIVIPGLLQTAEYARALFIAAGADEDPADQMVAARLERQAILDRPDPPHAVVVLDEAVLHRLIGTRAVMADQLAHVASTSERLHVSVHVLPATGANAGLSGAFDLASVDGTPDTLRMEGVEDQTTENRTLVRKAAILFDLVRRDALPRAFQSRTLILEAAEQWKSQ